jgi:hypothetical protein
MDAHALTFGLEQLHGAKVDLDLGDVIDERHAKTPIKCVRSQATGRVGKAVVRSGSILMQDLVFTTSGLSPLFAMGLA